MKLVSILLFAIIFLACKQQKSVKSTALSNPALDSARAGIDLEWKRHADAWLNRDLSTIPAFMDEKGIIVAIGKYQISGKSALDSAEADTFRQIRILSLKHTIEGLSVQNNIAYQLGLEEGKTESLENKKVSEYANRYMATWQKQPNGSYKLLYFVYYPK